MATSASLIWDFNALYWKALGLWEQATGQACESALPDGESDARNRDSVREIITDLFALGDSLAERNALPKELYVVEIGPGNGNQATTWLDEFVELDREHGKEYYRRLHYLMCDYSPHVLELARAAVAHHAEHDEPFLAGYPEDVRVAVEAINIVTQGVDVTWGLHACYGNRYARLSWEGHYDFLFPAVLDANVNQLILEFGRKGYEDLYVIKQLGGDRALGVGVVDVKTELVESADLITQRIRKALETFPADKLIINPDCGLHNLPADVARSTLAAMVEGTVAVRRTLLETQSDGYRSLEPPVALSHVTPHT